MALELLTVIIDANPCWWGRIMEELGDKEGIIFGRAIDAVISFCDTYRLLTPTNKLMVIAAGWTSSSVLYVNDGTAITSTTSNRGMDKDDENFLLYLKNRLKDYFTDQCNQRENTKTFKETRMAAPLAQALCYTNRLRKDNSPARSVESRILIVKVSDDSTTQHMSLMNIFFTAQKQHVPIDSCILLRDSALMQQACDITGGVYSKIKDVNSLLQYLLCLHLPNTESRNKMNFPASGDVDYRPACFCHQQLVSVGWVCSVCLSVFCKFSPICPTCQTVFKFLPMLPKVIKKKKVK